MLMFVSGASGIESGSGLDATVPNVARIYDFMLGGKDNFAADRQLAEQIMASVPTSAWSARQQRAFVVRAVRYCAQRGVGQFLDVGSGLPTMDNVHEVAQRVVPGAAVVYVDNDGVAVSHARALLATSAGVAAIWGDAREPQKILGHVETHELLDLTRPVVVLMTGILHFIADAEDPAGIVQVFRDAVPAGSYLVLSQATDDVRREDAEYAKNTMRRASAPHLHTRSHSEFAAFFAGLELVDPGLVLTVQWRPEEPVRNVEQAGIYVGVGRKP
jgi:S-adenosyl methyltransferase